MAQVRNCGGTPAGTRFVAVESNATNRPFGAEGGGLGEAVAWPVRRGAATLTTSARQRPGVGVAMGGGTVGGVGG